MHTKAALTLFTLTTLGLFWTGCFSSSATTEKEDETSSPVVDTNEKKLAGTNLETTKPDGAVAIPGAIDIQPANGFVLQNDRAARASVHFSGFTTAAGQTVEVQVLNDPTAAIAEENWVTIATTTSSATATSFNDPASIFRYDVDATPGDKWLEGGLLRFRTIVTDAVGAKTLLPFFDASSGTCVAAEGAKSWKELITKCKSPFSPDLGAALGSTTKAAALVSPSPEPEDRFAPNFLSRKGFIQDFETDRYYDFVDAPRTLDEFRFRFGFDRQAEVDADYYNRGDLGIGREMHCTTFDFKGQNGTACYVRNYGVRSDGVGDFSGDPDFAMDELLRGRDSFAAVCMVKFGTTFSDPKGNDVQFFVYDANENIANRAQLDSIDSNDAIPNNCTNCHGGAYDRNSGILSGSTFLPFDPDAFLFSDAKGASFAEQEDQIRQLNLMMKGAGAPPATFQFVNGAYDGKPDVAGTKTNLDWIPAGWSGSEEAKTVYREVYKPYCRTCHTAQVGDFAFITYDDFKAAGEKTMHSVCDLKEMPVAEATMGLFWRSPARAYLVNSLGASHACTPSDR